MHKERSASKIMLKGYDAIFGSEIIIVASSLDTFLTITGIEENPTIFAASHLLCPEISSYPPCSR